MFTSLPAHKIMLAVVLLLALNARVQPTISSFTPASGTVGTLITITGTNFNAVPVNNIVFMGAVKATVTGGNTTSLTIVAPTGATYQPISVLNTATGLTAYSSKPFIITFVRPGTGIPANYYKPKVDFATGSTPRSVTTADVDGDGKFELIVANGNSLSVSIFRNISTTGIINTSSFAAKVDFVTGNFTQHVAMNDVDADGKPDIVVINNNNVSILRNTSTPGVIDASSFAAKVDFDLVFTGPVFVAITDIDLDGKPDLLAVNASSNSVSILRNISTPGVVNSSSFAAKVNFTTGFTPHSVAIGDLDGDGKPELAITNSAAGSNSVSVLRNTSTPGIINAASFAAKVDFTTGTIPRSVAIGDVDDDGKPDLLVANSEPTSTTLSVLRNTSTTGIINASSFAAKVDFTTSVAPRSIAITDVDGDGKPDLVTANENAASISVFRNMGTSGINASSFASKVDFATGNGPVSVAIGDIDGDGIPEIAAANGPVSTVSVFQINLAALPVTLTNIKAFQKNTGVQVEWTAHRQIGIDRYEVERSQNGQRFSLLGNVQPINNSSDVIDYQLFDATPFNGANFYRIKVMEAGKATYSKVIRLNILNNAANSVSVYPNPVNANSISLLLNLPKGNYTISLINETGQQVITKLLNHPGGASFETIGFSKALSQGAYQLRVTDEKINITVQVIKN